MRDRELTVRSALGAGRGRLFRQLLAESAVLGSLGGLAGLPLAFWGTRALVALVPDDVYRLENAGMDARVLVFLLGASMLLALLFGVLPAMKGSGLDLSAALNTGARGSRDRGLGLLRLLVVSEVALALVLMVPYVFAGLAVVHMLCRRFAAGGVILAFFYAALIVWAAVLPLGLAVLGMIDHWVNLRRSPRTGPLNKEEE